MMKGIFKSYAEYYDVIYVDKDYEKECDILEEIFRRYSKSMPKTILDCGCGTGGHAIPLSKRDYEITGIDSSKDMISIAKKKSIEIGANINFKVMDLRELQLNKNFDACISMFAVMSYLTETKDLLRALINVRKHIKGNSLFVFDFWYGPAVLTVLPSSRMKTSEKDGVKVIRFAEPYLDSYHHKCEVNYTFIVIKGDLIINEGKEKHIVRYYFPEEMKHYLEESGFQLLKLCPFLDLNNQPSENTWDVMAITQAI